MKATTRVGVVRHIGMVATTSVNALRVVSISMNWRGRYIPPPQDGHLKVGVSPSLECANRGRDNP